VDAGTDGTLRLVPETKRQGQAGELLERAGHPAARARRVVAEVRRLQMRMYAGADGRTVEQGAPTEVAIGR